MFSKLVMRSEPRLDYDSAVKLCKEKVLKEGSEIKDRNIFEGYLAERNENAKVDIVISEGLASINMQESNNEHVTAEVSKLLYKFRNDRENLKLGMIRLHRIVISDNLNKAIKLVINKYQFSIGATSSFEDKIVARLNTMKPFMEKIVEDYVDVIIIPLTKMTEEMDKSFEHST